jgi:hypothetical protein
VEDHEFVTESSKAIFSKKVSRAPKYGHHAQCRRPVHLTLSRINKPDGNNKPAGNNKSSGQVTNNPLAKPELVYATPLTRSLASAQKKVTTMMCLSNRLLYWPVTCECFTFTKCGSTERAEETLLPTLSKISP